MTTLGVFRDDYYNAMGVLPQSAFASTAQNGGTLVASKLVGGGDMYLAASGQTTAQALTTDTAVNIIAQLQQAAQTFAAGNLGVGPPAGDNFPPGVPNIFNLTYTLTITNNNTSSGAITLTGGTGVTIVGTNTLTINSSRTYLVQITSLTTLTMTNVMSGTN